MSANTPISHRFAPALAAILCLSVPAPALAEEEDPGRQEYINSCSACHGDSARGDGPVARFLNVPTPNLTQLAQRNNGEFPFLQVLHIIDGRSGLGPHGTIMPVWGARFSEAAQEDFGRFGAEIVVRGRILSVVSYLETLQE